MYSPNKNLRFQSPEHSLCILHTFEMIQTSHNQMLIHGPSIGSAIRSFWSSPVHITCHTSLFKFVVHRATMEPCMVHCTKRVHHSVSIPIVLSLTKHLLQQPPTMTISRVGKIGWPMSQHCHGIGWNKLQHKALQHPHFSNWTW